MMDPYGPNLVARLVPLNERTRKAFSNKHNKQYYVPPSFQGDRAAKRTNQKPTLLEADRNRDNQPEDTEPELVIRFDSRPKHISKGWVFGSDRKVCDIYCGERGDNYDIGRQTFSITINEHKTVTLKHLDNTNRTKVQYDHQLAKERGEFVWIMAPFFRAIIVISASQLKFQVRVARFRRQSDEYQAFERLCSQFLRDVDLTASRAAPGRGSVSMPGAMPFYFERSDKVLGRGRTATVYSVIDVSTAIAYAGKKFNAQYGFIHNEVEILKTQNHPNILKFINFTKENGSLLVTEWMVGGDLSRPWQTKDRPPYSSSQIFRILLMSLHGLASLHASPNPVIHRDIKPENILVTGDEDKPWIKLADFGVATQGTEALGLAGTFLYAAPEIFDDLIYDSKVDIWSLGVVMIQLLLGGRVPKPSKLSKLESYYCHNVSTSANEIYEVFCKWAGGESVTLLYGFVVNHMVQLDPGKRLSAQECVDHPDLREMILQVVQDERRNHETQHSSAQPAGKSSSDLMDDIHGMSILASKGAKTPKAVQESVEASEAARIVKIYNLPENRKLPQNLRPADPQPLRLGPVKENVKCNAPENEQTPVGNETLAEPEQNGPSHDILEAARILHTVDGPPVREMKRPGSPSVGKNPRRKPSVSAPAVEASSSKGDRPSKAASPAQAPAPASPYNVQFTSVNAPAGANDAKVRHDTSSRSSLDSAGRDLIKMEYGEDVLDWVNLPSAKPPPRAGR